MDCSGACIVADAVASVWRGHCGCCEVCDTRSVVAACPWTCCRCESLLLFDLFRFRWRRQSPQKDHTSTSSHTHNQRVRPIDGCSCSSPLPHCTAYCCCGVFLLVLHTHTANMNAQQENKNRLSERRDARFVFSHSSRFPNCHCDLLFSLRRLRLRIVARFLFCCSLSLRTFRMYIFRIWLHSHCCLRFRTTTIIIMLRYMFTIILTGFCCLTNSLWYFQTY